jgi:cytochrome P450
MLRDETLYSDPHAFKPERFIKDGEIDPNVLDPHDVIFGFGKRYLSNFALNLENHAEFYCLTRHHL